jgi:D-tyrosyl-tRNA(Tyr) deacylase
LISLIQRVSEASVSVAGTRLAAIGPGLLALVGVRPADTPDDAVRLVRRIIEYRVFGDAAGRMNRSLADVRGGLLLVPQFTLAAETRKGTRPGFSTAAPPEHAKQLFDLALEEAKTRHTPVASGVFGADMQVFLINDGPVTFWLES